MRRGHRSQKFFSHLRITIPPGLLLQRVGSVCSKRLSPLLVVGVTVVVKALLTLTQDLVVHRCSCEQALTTYKRPQPTTTERAATGTRYPNYNYSVTRGFVNDNNKWTKKEGLLSVCMALFALYVASGAYKHTCSIHMCHLRLCMLKCQGGGARVTTTRRFGTAITPRTWPPAVCPTPPGHAPQSTC